MRFLAFLVALSVALSQDFNPYHVLGVSRNAKSEEIKRAYREKAKQWHPDKNPEGHDTFLQIQKSFDILSDDEQRRQYDTYGSVDSQRQQQQQQQQQQQYQHFYSGPYGGYYQQQQQRMQNYYSSRNEGAAVKITANNYDYLVMGTGGGDEELRVWFLYASSDYCQSCEKITPQYEEAAKSLKSAGIYCGRVNTDFESDLARKLGIRSVPVLWAVSVQSGRTRTFWSDLNARSSAKEMSARSMIDWVGSIFEKHAGLRARLHMLAEGDGKNKNLDGFKNRLERFTTQMEEEFPERVTVFVVSSRPDPHIIFKLLAEKFQKSLTFAYIGLPSVNPSPSVQTDAARLLSPSLADLLSHDDESGWSLSRPALVIRRESGTPDVVLTSGIKNDFETLSNLLTPHRSLYLPKLTWDNLYSYCYEPREVICLVILAKSQADARKQGLSLVTSETITPLLHTRWPSSPAEPPSPPSTKFKLQLTWMNINEQTEMTHFFSQSISESKTYREGCLYSDPRGDIPSVVLLKSAQYLPFTGKVKKGGGGGEKRTVVEWLDSLFYGPSQCSFMMHDSPTVPKDTGRKPSTKTRSFNERELKEMDNIPYLQEEPSGGFHLLSSAFDSYWIHRFFQQTKSFLSILGDGGGGLLTVLLFFMVFIFFRTFANL